MKGFNNKIKKSLLCNLIVFDFIFLTTFTKKTSNFVEKKYHIGKKLYIVRLAILEILKGLKRFLRFFQFLSKWINKKVLIYICLSSVQYIKFLQILFKKYNMNISLNINTLLPGLSLKKYDLKAILFLDKVFSKSNDKNLKFYNYFLVQEVNSSNNNNNLGSYKIYNNLDDFKKLLFLGIFLLQIFKK